MESTSKTLVELADMLCPQGIPQKILATGGGAKSKLWLKIKSGLLDAEIIKPDCDEPACKGAAMLFFD